MGCLEGNCILGINANTRIGRTTAKVLLLVRGASAAINSAIHKYLIEKKAARLTELLVPRRVVMSVLVLAMAMASGKTMAKDAAMSELVKLGSTYPFSETVEKLRSALQSSGFTIFAVIDQREAAKAAGLDMPSTTLIVYGNPKGGTPMMIAAPDFAIELPLRVLVREDPSGKALVLFSPVSALEGKHGLPPGKAAKLAGGEAVIVAAIGLAKQN